MTAERDRAWLLQIARDAITQHVTHGSSERPAAGGQQPAAGSPEPAVAERRAGVFVTIHCRGDLRGCIGRLEADLPLPRSVAYCAVAACSEDRRFPAIDSSELPYMTLEVSVLGPMEPAAGPADIEIGRHGLMIEQGRRRGLLLPQVAVEWRWDAVTFLSETCRKAGLAPDSWQRGAAVWRFDAEVFGDETPH
jgi:AmmeMemoRadiSam system protein A